MKKQFLKLKHLFNFKNATILVLAVIIIAGPMTFQAQAIPVFDFKSWYDQAKMIKNQITELKNQYEMVKNSAEDIKNGYQSLKNDLTMLKNLKPQFSFEYIDTLLKTSDRISDTAMGFPTKVDDVQASVDNLVWDTKSLAADYGLTDNMTVEEMMEQDDEMRYKFNLNMEEVYANAKQEVEDAKKNSIERTINASAVANENMEDINKRTEDLIQQSSKAEGTNEHLAIVEQLTALNSQQMANLIAVLTAYNNSNAEKEAKELKENQAKELKRRSEIAQYQSNTEIVDSNSLIRNDVDLDI